MGKMLLTQALNELKVLDTRIMREICSAEFITAAKRSEKNVRPNKTKEDFEKEAKGYMQSIKDLMSERDKIKSAIVISNANTYIEICGEKHTVAEAIDMKNSMRYKQTLLEEMEKEYVLAKNKVEEENRRVESKIDLLVETSYGKDNKSKVNEQDYLAIAKPYRENNEYCLVDPIGLEKEIKNLRTWVEDFLSNIDSKLQISNCTTYIEI